MRRPRRPRLVIALLAAFAILMGVPYAAFLLTRDAQASGGRSTVGLPSIPSGGDAVRPGSSSPPASGDDVRALEAVPVVDAPPSTQRISGESAAQPDLYAAEFVRRLLTQDYRTSRDTFVAWVQAEQAPCDEPLVVGQVPAGLRSRLALWSVTDERQGPAPVPGSAQWATLGRAGVYTTARVDRVTEPLSWTNAVADGRITDPGVTGRLVLATVTRHTGQDSQSFSVAVSLNLEGPPSRPAWGVVVVVAYTFVPITAP